MASYGSVLIMNGGRTGVKGFVEMLVSLADLMMDLMVSSSVRALIVNCMTAIWSLTRSPMR